MKSYQIVRAETVRGLIEFVNTEMKHGWKPTGGLAVLMQDRGDILTNPTPVFLQAMIHPEGNNI